MHTIDLRNNEPRSPHEELGGVKLLARVIDKGRAAMDGTLGPYRFFDCPLDRVFFDAVNVSRSEFLDMLQRTYAAEHAGNVAALADMRESLESKPEVSDECFMAFAEAREADGAAVAWLVEERLVPRSVLLSINDAVDRLPPEDLIDWIR